MSYISPWVLDNGLLAMHNTADAIMLTSEVVTDYPSAVGPLAVGVKTYAPGGAVGAPINATNPVGRRVRTTAITDGVVNKTGSGAAFAILDTVNQRLLASGLVSVPQEVTLGSEFRLGAIEVRLNTQGD